MYLDKGDFELAIKYYESLSEEFPKNYEYQFNLAMAYKNHHDWERAKTAYKKAIELNPKSHEAYFNLAYLCFNENRPQDAVECYKKALEVKPDDWESSYFLGLAQMQVKDYKDGLKTLNHGFADIVQLFRKKKLIRI